MGIKDLSLIKTPPVDRKSVETKVIKFDKLIIKMLFTRKKPLWTDLFNSSKSKGYFKYITKYYLFILI